ncbi:MAG: GNAT family N-acetyltransferase [Ferruginibacter sp.]
MADTNWECKKFMDLSVEELYWILKLRSEVFVVEQNCVYLDTDDKDQAAMHLCGWQNNLLVGYLRILSPGVSYTEPSIGRVCTNTYFRKTGIGKILMKEGIEYCYKLFPDQNIRISAQVYLLNFYKNLGFKQVSEHYLEDNIPHAEMLHIK